jgi:6-phosphofructokinase 1
MATTKVKKIAVLTGGGDCPGLNAVIRAVSKTAMHDYGIEVWGIEDGYNGLITRRARKFDNLAVSGILTVGGSILGCSNKDNPFAQPMKVNGEIQYKNVSVECVQYMRDMEWDAMICIGGDGTMNISNKFMGMGVNIVGVPKTIDNDLAATDYTFGFNTAVATATEAIDKLHSTAMSHHRVMIVEMMGRYAGWLALEAGIAGGGDVILLPEIPFDIQYVADYCLDRSHKGKRFSIVVVSEGAKPKGGEMVVARTVPESPDPIRLGGIGHKIAHELEQITGLSCRATVLGHLQRGGSPTAYDRILSTRFGHAAARLVAEGRFGRMVSLRGHDVVDVPIEDAIAKLKLVPPDHPLIAAGRSIGTCFGDRAC